MTEILIIKRYLFKRLCCFRRYLFFLYVTFSTLIYSQDNSEAYLSIKNNTQLSSTEKEDKIDSLMLIYQEYANYSWLANDYYDYAKWHFKYGTLNKALSASKQAIQFIDSLPLFDEALHKKAVNNVGFFYAKKLDYYNAYKYYSAVTKIGTQNAYSVRSYRLAALQLKYMGDYYKAAEYFESSISLAKKMKEDRLFIVNSINASVNYKLIETSKSLNRGIEILDEAILLANSKISDKNAKNIVDDKLMFSLYDHLGNLYNDRDDYDFINAKRNYDKALTLALKIKDSSRLSLVYNDFGYLYLHKMQPKAINYFNIALTYVSNTSLKSIIYENKAIYYLNLNDKHKALQNVQLAINVVSPINIEIFETSPSKEALANCKYKNELLESLIIKGNIWLNSYEQSPNKDDLKHALSSYSLADHLIDLIRFESDASQSKLYWRKVASKVYLNAVKTCHYLNKAEEAFYYMEKNKSLLLLEDLTLKQQNEHANLPDDIYNRQLYLKKEQLKYTQLLSNTPQKSDSLRPLLMRVKDSYGQFLDSLETNYSFYYRTQKPAPILSLAEAQQTLTSNSTGYIEYILNDEEGYGMFITKNKSKFFKIEAGKNLKDLALIYRTLLERPLSTKKDIQVYSTTSSSIFQSLFADVISNEPELNKLIIIPDGYLQSLPFEALQTSVDATTYLIEQYDLNYAYSISYLQQNNAQARKNTKNFLGLAPIKFKNGEVDLPDSERELELATSLFSSDSFLYDQATKQNFIINSKDHHIIHIATHANAIENESPWILFDDTKLTLDELYLTENTANLVVLSACKTSLGSMNAGEGVMSLARGFFNTGANSVLATLWNVNDSSSSKIVQDFYTFINKGKSKSEALRLAKLKYLKEHSLSERSPYYWSSFILIGNSGKIPLNTNYTYYITIFFVLIIVIIGFFYFKRKNNPRLG